VLELPRKHTRAQDLLAEELGNLSLGKHLSSAVRSGHNIFVGPELARIDAEDFRAFLARYFQAQSRMA